MSNKALLILKNNTAESITIHGRTIVGNGERDVTELIDRYISEENLDAVVYAISNSIITVNDGEKDLNITEGIIYLFKVREFHRQWYIQNSPSYSLVLSSNDDKSVIFFSDSNSYPSGSIKAVANSNGIDIVATDSNTDYYSYLNPEYIYINNVPVNSILYDAVDMLNSFFNNVNNSTGTIEEIGVSSALVSNTLTVTKSDNSTVDLDITKFGVHSELNVISGVLNGNVLDLTMNDNSVISIDSLRTTIQKNSVSIPVINSPSNISLINGKTLNFELESNNSVVFSWENLPQGIEVVPGDEKRIIGGSNLSVGSYNFSVRAINYYSEVTQSFTLDVVDPAYIDTRSILLKKGSHLRSDVSVLSSVLGRPADGAGSSDAWTISLWFKVLKSGNPLELLYYGQSDKAMGHIEVSIDSDDQVNFVYGTETDNISFVSNVTITEGSWNNLMICYTGDSTQNLDQMPFKMFINSSTLTGSYNVTGAGYVNSIEDSFIQLGNRIYDYQSNYSVLVNELAVWDSDRQLDITNLYNSGLPSDLSTASVVPSHWWRMGDGESADGTISDFHPEIQDNLGSVTLNMYNMTMKDVFSDTPH